MSAEEEASVASTRDAHPWKSRHENDGLSRYGGGTESASERDIVGYGRHRGQPAKPVQWPNGAKVALNFVINYEEGGENCLLHGDPESEKLLSEIVGAAAYPNERHANMESLYDYGSRAGFWRLHRLFLNKEIPCTVYAVGMALERNPEVCQVLKERMNPSEKNDASCPKWEVASHGYRWIDYQNMDEETERDHIRRTIQIHERLLGQRPVGMYQGKPNIHTRKLVVEEGGFKYDSDSYADDLPYWTYVNGSTKPHLVIPYTLSENDMCFVRGANFPTGKEFGQYLKDNLQYAVHEGREYGHMTMMNVGLHCRLMRPGRVSGLADFIEYAKTAFGNDVWICTREQIADHWYENHYPTSNFDDDESRPEKKAKVTES